MAHADAMQQTCHRAFPLRRQVLTPASCRHYGKYLGASPKARQNLPQAELASHAGTCLNPVMNILLRCFCLFCLLTASTAMAYQDPAPVKQAIEDYLRIQTQGLPGKSSFSVGTIEPNNNLPPCQAFEVSLPPRSAAWGRTTATVRCLSDGGWKIYVPVTIRVVAEYLVSARDLAQGQPLGAGDIRQQSGDLGELPNGTLTNPAEAIGRIAIIAIPAGRPLRGSFLRQPPAVQQGQSVKIRSRGAGFEVFSEGRALNTVSDGQVAQVRLNNGQVLSGIARTGGIVEITY